MYRSTARLAKFESIRCSRIILSLRIKFTSRCSSPIRRDKRCEKLRASLVVDAVRCTPKLKLKSFTDASDDLPANLSSAFDEIALQVNSNLFWKQRARSKLTRTSFPRPRRCYSTKRISGFVVTKVSPSRCLLLTTSQRPAAETIGRTNVGKKKARSVQVLSSDR